MSYLTRATAAVFDVISLPTFEDAEDLDESPDVLRAELRRGPALAEAGFSL